MPYKQIAFVANGEIPHLETLRNIIKMFPYLVAVDGGLNHCFHLKIFPQLVVGDCDSATTAALEWAAAIPKYLFPREKDFTDLELAIQKLDSPEVEQMVIFGGLGGRIDHTLFNVHLLSRYKGRLFLEGVEERLFVLDKKIILQSQPGQILSLIPLNGPVTEIYTRGLKWELKGKTLDKHFMGISNVCLSERVEIEVRSADLLVYQKLASRKS